MSKISIKNLLSHRKHRKLLISSLILLICLGIGLFISQKIYHADTAVMADLKSTSTVTVIQDADYYAFIPHSSVNMSAFILYPGALVDAQAYVPLMSKLAQQGYATFIAKMPLDLAILKGNAADTIISDYPNITNWYIGGHSLGGVMAASYADQNPDLIKGIAFLASYPNKDLTDQSLKIVSLYGTNDSVLNMNSYEDAKSLVNTAPPNYQEIQIPGGNHANFGNYGPQSGDTTATISADKQQAITVSALAALMTN